MGNEGRAGNHTGGQRHHLPRLQMLSVAASKNLTQRHTRLTQCVFTAALFMTIKGLATRQMPWRGLPAEEHTAQDCAGSACAGAGPEGRAPSHRRLGSSPSLRALTSTPDFPGGGGRGSPRGKGFKQTEQTQRAQRQAGTPWAPEEANQQPGKLKRKSLQLARGAQRSSLLFVASPGTRQAGEESGDCTVLGWLLAGGSTECTP